MTIEKNKPDLVISYLVMRKAIGWLGMLLPFTLLIGNYLINQLNILNNNFFVCTKCFPGYHPDHSFKSSISHYYYTTVGELFTGILSAVALFLFCYKGHKLRLNENGPSDNALANLAGFFALGVILFPTGSDVCIHDNMRSFLSSRNTGSIHLIMAALFFFSLALMSIVNFRRTEKVGMYGKNKDDNFYLVCGFAMIICLLLIATYSIWLIDKNIGWLDAIHPVFCLEAIALIFFGLSWLTKGKADMYYLPKKLKLIK